VPAYCFHAPATDQPHEGMTLGGGSVTAAGAGNIYQETRSFHELMSRVRAREGTDWLMPIANFTSAGGVGHVQISPRTTRVRVGAADSAR
jgi:hypothetical protein